MVVYNSTLDTELVDFLQIANTLLAKCGISFKLRSLDDFTPDMFVLIFENVLHCTLTEQVRMPHSREDHIHNVQCVVDSLAIDILNIDLSHITGEAIVNGDRQALCNLLEIFAGVAEYLAIDQNATHISHISNVSGDRGGEFLDDPDIVCGRGGLHIISEETTASSERYQNVKKNSNNRNHSMTTTVTGSGDEVHRGLGIANDKKLTLAEHTRKSRLTREVKSAGGDANMKVASPDVSSVKTVAPLQVTSPDFFPAPNLRHAPAFWDLNEAGDAATAFGTVKPSDNNHLYEGPFASAGGKSDSSQYSGVNPVVSDDDDVNIQCASTNINFDHPSAMGDCFERNSSTFSPFVAKTPETGVSTTYGRLFTNIQEKDIPSVTQMSSMYDYPIRVANEFEPLQPSAFSTSAEEKCLAENELRLSNRNEVPTVSFSSTSSSMADDPKPVTSVEILPKSNFSNGLDSAGSERCESIEPLFSKVDENFRRLPKKASKNSISKTSTLSIGKPMPSLKLSRTSEADFESKHSNDSNEFDSSSGKVPSRVNLNKTHDETFTKNDSEVLSKTGFNENSSDQACNTMGSLYSSVPRPLSPIELTERKSTNQVQDAAVQCSYKLGRKPIKTAAEPNAKRVAKQMPDVFERLYPKRPPSSASQSGVKNSSIASCESKNVSVPHIKDITLNSVSIVKETSNPPPLYLSTTTNNENTSLLGKGGKTCETSTSLQTSDIFKDSLKLNLSGVSLSADTSSNTVNAIESMNESETLKWKLKNLPKCGSKGDTLKLRNDGSADTSEGGNYPGGSLGSSFANKAFSSSQEYDLKASAPFGMTSLEDKSSDEVNDDEEYEIIRRRLLDKLQQFRIGDRSNNGEDTKEFGAVREFKRAPKELSGRWANVRERLDEETEREKENTEHLKRNLAKTFRQVRDAEELKVGLQQAKLEKVNNELKSLHKLASMGGYAKGSFRKKYSGRSGVIISQRSNAPSSRSSRTKHSILKSNSAQKQRQNRNSSFLYSPEQASLSKSFDRDKTLDSSRSDRGPGKIDKSGGQEPPEIGQNEMLSYLLDEFPQLKLSKEMAHVLWKKQMKQMQYLASSCAANNGTSPRGQNLSESIGGTAGGDPCLKHLREAERRQKLLMGIMKKEINHSIRMKERQEQVQRECIVKTNVREQKQASARIRRYYDEFQVRMRSRMAKKKSKEEQIFKELFSEGLEIQKTRISEIRKYCREKREARATKQKNEVESLENYYRDQFAILAEAVDNEKKEVELSDKAQALALEKMKNELRSKLESDIKLLQSQLVENDDAVYFRRLEADKMRKQLQTALFKADL